MCQTKGGKNTRSLERERDRGNLGRGRDSQIQDGQGGREGLEIRVADEQIVLLRSPKGGTL